MQFLSHIPFNIINSIGFLSFLLFVYECFKYFYHNNATLLFRINAWMQILGLVHFLVMLAFPHLYGSISVAEWMSQKYILIHETGWLHLLPVLGMIYCVTLIVLLFKTIYQIAAVQKIKQNANYDQSQYFNSFISSHTHISIGLSNEIDSPITFGWFSPVILLPFSICNQLTLQEVETILMHELAHILRHDYIIHIILTLIQTILFFNPIIYLFKKESNLQREIACDQFVVHHNNHKLDYMNALYKLALVSHTNANPKTTMGVLGTQNELLVRMKQLSNTSYLSVKTGILKIILMGMLCIMVGISSWSVALKKQTSMMDALPNEANQTILNEANAIHNHLIGKTYKNTSSNHLMAKKNIKHNSKHVIKKSSGTNTNWVKTNSPMMTHHELENESYASLVKQTMHWIQSRQGDSYFASFDENEEEINYTIAEKLLMRTIISNYQLKRDILNNKLSKALYEQEAIDTILNSKEYAEMKQFEKWVKEFLKQHPTEATAPIVY
jgi:beta-lactamase regulating signal transducer with metallopeptidase domain